ncbi:MAG: SUMF1/EgtB/PvdO family nonheme iron enzyme [Gammaproteobacteria bacterium]|nr:SUMF1/EgtB/PvdO family nonheme iron enzyme [Gammaproteobacteria bacterium]MBU1725791.1 SUMF1/EgtB/PvdO family nonheme iron enzyme [Gammaproteobacteria bacterium]MBU2007294.1 SUMF1/EgtB/PvdO family nonheme iron enzyme [Gammaproteobacteria bacterium]
MSKSYLNFDLLLNEAGDSYQVHVIDSPAGQASRTFTLPFSAVELENFILKIGQNRGSVRSLHIERIDVPSIQKLGGALYEALFGGAIAERFRSSLAIARREGCGLRIRLRLSGAPKLIDIPWELLFDADNNNYIGLSVNTPIIRKLDLATLPEMRQAQGVLQVLVMISSPSNYQQLDVEREWERINTATLSLQKEGRLILTRVEPSLAALQRQLRRGEYHVFHYIGHGGFDRTNSDGVLVLEDRNKKGHLVSGQYLGTILYDETTLQLVLLNSCSGGRTSVTDPFAGVGQSLLQKGIPAVIAMQFEITDEAAITFSHEFYAALVDGYSIDAAVAEARKMIYAEANQLEWATPVLYTSIDSGSLLREPTAEELALLEKQRQQREEAKRQAELKRQQQEDEAKRQAELQRQAEEEAARQAELKRQEEAKRQTELKRQAEEEKAKQQVELKRQEEESKRQELKRQKEEEAKQQADLKLQAEEVKRQAELKRQLEERKHQEELLPPKEPQSLVGASPAGDSSSGGESPAGLAPTEERVSPPPAINAISAPLPTPAKRFAGKSVAIVGVVLMLGIGGFVWKQNSGNRTSIERTSIENVDVNPIEPEMASIPAGSFTMGCKSGRDDVLKDGCDNDEKPSHKVTLMAFQMAKYEVTFDEWDACEKANACPHAEDEGWGRGKRPVINVSWNDITQKYIPWLNKKTGKTYRLPSEAEWEYAARGGKDKAFPWGKSLGKNNANCDGCGSQWDNKQTASVGSFSANGYGLYDTSGNAWEWVQDWSYDDYKGAPVDGSSWESGDSAYRVLSGGLWNSTFGYVLRGGSWNSTPRYVRSAHRYYNSPGSWYNNLGFRLASGQ